jgi:hypothetical protein
MYNIVYATRRCPPIARVTLLVSDERQNLASYFVIFFVREQGENKHCQTLLLIHLYQVCLHRFSARCLVKITSFTNPLSSDPRPQPSLKVPLPSCHLHLVFAV